MRESHEKGNGMESPLIKNVERGQSFSLAALISPRPHQVASLNLWRSGTSHITLFGFDAGEGISREVLDEDRLYIVLEGDMVIDADGKRQSLKSGDCTYIPAGMPHSLDVITPGKALLVTVG